MVAGSRCAMTFTSVAGHLMELDFPASHKGWRSCSLVELFSAPVHKTVPQVSAALYPKFICSFSCQRKAFGCDIFLGISPVQRASAQDGSAASPQVRLACSAHRHFF